MKGYTDEQLVVSFRQGNDEAFDTLLKRYESKIYSYIFYAVKNEEEANDLFQEVFMRVIATIKSGRYNEMNKFASWLMRITHNQVIDYHRQNRSAQILSNDETEADLFSDASIAVDENREREMIDQQTLSEIKQLITMLPQNQREVVLMRFYDELSFKEIAEKTGVSINTALGRMRYALINMRKLAQKYDVSLTF